MKIKDNAIALLPCSTCGRRDRISTTLNNYLKIWVTICHGCYLKYRQELRQPQGYAGLGETEALSITDWNHLSEQVSNGQKPCRSVREAAQALGIEFDESAAQERLDFETGKRMSDE